MRVPAFLTGAALLLWGWQNQTLGAALVLVLVVESPRWVRWRWNLSYSDFNRFGDLTTVLFVLVTIYQFDAHAFHGIYGLLRWLPGVFVFLVAAQIYSTRDNVSYAVLFLSNIE